MTDGGQTANPRWLKQQVTQYKRVHPRYELFAEKLDAILRREVARLAPLSIVQVRPKSIGSFAEKAVRKRHKHDDPVNDFTDLCGARIIARTRSEVDALSEFVKASFEIDWENSLDAADRLDPSEFGYRSVHYIVSFKPGTRFSGVTVPRSLHGLKAEVQLRTTVEHAWADFAHDLSYKGAFELPTKWKRALAVIAAELEDVDQAFERFEEGLRVYASTYGAYMSQEEIPGEIETLELIRAADRRDPGLAWRIAKLAMRLEDWEKAIEVLTPHVDPTNPGSAAQPILRDLGVVLCKAHAAKPNGRAYRRGQRYLELAIEAAPGDADALASYAGTWRSIKSKDAQSKAREYYRRGFEADSTDYYPLGNYLEYELRRTGDTSVLPLLEPVIRAAVERCRVQAEVGMNLPWAHFGIGKLLMLLGEPYESLRAYAKGVQASTAAFMIEGSLSSLEMLSVVSDQLEGYEWARRLLLLGLAARFPSRSAKRRVSELARGQRGRIEGPVVIVVGATDPSIQERMESYRVLMLEAFRDFRGTVISGGTQQGVSGLVGEVSETYPEIRAVGYVPGAGSLPGDATRDKRYDEIRRTQGRGFSPLEPLENWIDLMASGIEPHEVKVLGINGGPIAALEYRIALALGASVGVIEETGREATRLLGDEEWAVSETLVPMPADAQTVRAFIGSGTPKLSRDDREKIAIRIHEAHREESAKPVLRPWAKTSEDFRSSSRRQADHILEKLRQIGCEVRGVDDRKIALMQFTDDEVETMAEMEHGRWNAERLSTGWKWGEKKDEERRISPYLVSWAELPEDIREWDRATVRRIPAYLEEVGLEICRP